MYQTDRFDIKNIYSTIEEIELELPQRLANTDLRERVSKAFSVPPSFIENTDSQYAFVSRPVITPNQEIKMFIETIRHFPLTPKLLEYPGTFVLHNKEKRGLAEIRAHTHNKEQGHNPSFRIVDFREWEGCDITKITTNKGERLIDAHHKIFEDVYPNLGPHIIDFSEWFNSSRKRPGLYYFEYLCLFLRNGVLFENFLHNDKRESYFFKEKILPSFNRIVDEFGIKPLIFPLLPIDDEKNSDWLTYDSQTYTKFKSLLPEN